MSNEIDTLKAEIKRLQDHDNAACHIIIEAGLVPGFNPPCRCEECRLIARGMAEAGYLDRCDVKWWEDEPPPADQGDLYD